jgi:hypothetical protein
MRRLTLLIAIALAAAACGSDGTSDTFAAPSTAVADSTGQTSSTSTTVDSGTTPTASPDGATTTTPPAPAPGELPDSDYPDVVVADLAGGEVNLKELALETEPVLLWFWAPH